MLHRDQAVPHHSPALWGLLGLCAGEVLLVVGWNLWDRRSQVRAWLKL
jgi:hypothetical protein